MRRVGMCHIRWMGGMSPMGDMVVLVCVLGVLRWVVVVVVVVGGRILLHVAVLGMVRVHLGLCLSLGGALVMPGGRMLSVLLMGDDWWVRRGL